MEGSETFKYNPRPKGLRAYKDYDTDDDVSQVHCKTDSVKSEARVKRSTGKLS